MKRLCFFGDTVNMRHIDEAVRVLLDGGVVIYPTDTMYALGCDALNAKAIDRLCRLKGINPDKQLLSIVCASFSQASEYARIDNRAFRMMKDALPGPFTFVLPAASALPRVFRGRKSVGVRIPDCAVATELALSLGHPILSTSVEMGADSDETVNPDRLADKYNHDADLLLDRGEVARELSTVIDCLDSSSPIIIRQGKGVIDL